MGWFSELLLHFRRKGDSRTDHSENRDEVARDEDTGLTLGVACELAELAEKSFDPQIDLDESVWRSLPFFAAALAIAVTVLARVAEGLPPPSRAVAPLLANGAFWLSVASFAWMLRWFWDVLRPRDYEYPADDAEIRSYAEHMSAFYASQNLSDKALNDRVLLELKLFLAKHLGDAARANLRQNVAKLKGRSQLLLFVLLGFALVIVAESITYVSAFGTGRNVDGYASAKGKQTAGGMQLTSWGNESAQSAEAARDTRGSGIHEAQLRHQDSEQIMAKDEPQKPGQSQSTKPPPPAPQLIKRQEQGSPKPGKKST